VEGKLNRIGEAGVQSNVVELPASAAASGTK